MKKSFLMISLAISVILTVAFTMMYVPMYRTTGTIKQGILEGKVDIGPICPVERVSESCLPPEVYSSRMIYIYTKDGKSLYGQVSIQIDGTYETQLPAGEYVVNLKPNGMDISADVPAGVVIREGEITNLNISIYTGGILEGKVNIGPICPVERPGVPCPVPPEAYASRMIYIYVKGQNTVYGQVSIKSDGTYQAALPAGQYVVDLKPNGIDRSAEVPANVVIKQGETTTLDISIDTGIR